ncbi:MAG: hypothetical protein RLZZ293_434 [Pseudomonadota bacterium]|jgi:hypothetical protein
MDICGGKITDSVNVNKNCISLFARTTTIISRKAVLIFVINGKVSELVA